MHESFIKLSTENCYHHKARNRPVNHLLKEEVVQYNNKYQDFYSEFRLEHVPGSGSRSLIDIFPDTKIEQHRHLLLRLFSSKNIIIQPTVVNLYELEAVWVQANVILKILQSGATDIFISSTLRRVPCELSGYWLAILLSRLGIGLGWVGGDYGYWTDQ